MPYRIFLKNGEIIGFPLTHVSSRAKFSRILREIHNVEERSVLPPRLQRDRASQQKFCLPNGRLGEATPP
jgi:hypothetical protein